VVEPGSHFAVDGNIGGFVSSMKPNETAGVVRLFLSGAACALLFVMPGICGAQTAGGAEEGFYTPAQAEQGKKLYGTRCAACHGADLGGVSAPSLAGPVFERNWISTTTLDDLFYLIRTTMPVGMAKTLTAEQHAAVFAYILEENGYPAGGKAVDQNNPRLKITHVKSTRPGTGHEPLPIGFFGDAKTVSAPPPVFIFALP
jgi:S-disulfanyl-L-cysteine oxidoreductase SoxD